jgi:hypothetical protein
VTKCGGLSVGCCCLQAGAAEKGVPLYKYIAQLAGNSKLVSSSMRTRNSNGVQGQMQQGYACSMPRECCRVLVIEQQRQ